MSEEKKEIEDIEVEEEKKEDEEETKENLLTQEQVNEIIGKRLKKEREKFEKELEQKEKLAGLSAEKKAEELRKIKEKELEERENKIKFLELEIETKKQLNAEGIPESFSDMLIQNDKESTEMAIKTFKENWEKELNSRVEAEVNERLKSPKQDVGGNIENLSNGLGLDKISELAQEANIRK